MRILVLQHARVEHPGSLRTWLEEDGHEWVAVHLDEGEPLPSLDEYDALWVMGGPMDVWEEDRYAWLKPEKALIRDAVELRGMPYLGLCLGHQLLADALGGECGPSQTPEIGVLDVQLTEEGASGVLLDNVPELFPALQWHSAEVTRMPAGATCLATSSACTVQAMRWGTRACSLQFHVEVEDDTVDNWNALPTYATALENALGEDGADALKKATSALLPTFKTLSERIYINWLQMAART